MNEVFIDPIFALPIYRFKNLDFVNQNTVELCNRLCDKRRDSMLLSDHTNILELPEFVEIKSFLYSHLKNYVEQVYSIDNEVYFTNSFITIKNNSDSHRVHNHPNSFVSGVYYINCPENSTIDFYDNPQVFSGLSNLSFKINEYNIFNSNKWSYDIKSGDLILFPSHLMHGVETNTSNQSRIVIGFNSFFRGSLEKEFYCTDLNL